MRHVQQSTTTGQFVGCLTESSSRSLRCRPQGCERFEIFSNSCLHFFHLLESKSQSHIYRWMKLHQVVSVETNIFWYSCIDIYQTFINALVPKRNCAERNSWISSLRSGQILSAGLCFDFKFWKTAVIPNFFLHYVEFWTKTSRLRWKSEWWSRWSGQCFSMVEGWTLKKSDRNRIEFLRCGAGERCSEFLGKNTVPIYQY